MGAFVHSVYLYSRNELTHGSGGGVISCIDGKICETHRALSTTIEEQTL